MTGAQLRIGHPKLDYLSGQLPLVLVLEASQEAPSLSGYRLRLMARWPGRRARALARVAAAVQINLSAGESWRQDLNLRFTPQAQGDPAYAAARQAATSGLAPLLDAYMASFWVEAEIHLADGGKIQAKAPLELL